jgi:hypothetical protein
MRRLAAVLGLALIISGATSHPVSATMAAEPVLLPHRAVYALSLGGLTASSTVVDAAGRFEFEWQNVCDGWTVSQKFRIALVYEDGISVSFGWSLSSWEAQDGSRYRFFIRRYDGGGRTEAVDGEAVMKPDGTGLATFRAPEAREVVLPKGTLFPTRHTLHVLQQAVAGSAPIWTMVFDGSGEEGLFGVSAALSQRLGPQAPARLTSPLLEDLPSWRVQLAFFGPEAGNVEPEQEQGLRLFANGVVDEMTLDYGDFELEAGLTELTGLPEPDC